MRSAQAQSAPPPPPRLKSCVRACSVCHVSIQTASGPLLVISIGLRDLFQWSGRFKLFLKVESEWQFMAFKSGSYMICNDRRRSAARGRRPSLIVTDHMGALDTADGRRRTIWVIGRVELGSTFPTITISPTTTDFNGNACLGWSAAISDRPLFLLKHVRVSYCPIRIKTKVCRYFRTHFVPARASASGLLRLMGFLVCDRQQLYGNTCMWYLRLIDRRRSLTVTDHMVSAFVVTQLATKYQIVRASLFVTRDHREYLNSDSERFSGLDAWTKGTLWPYWSCSLNKNATNLLSIAWCVDCEFTLDRQTCFRVRNADLALPRFSTKFYLTLLMLLSFVSLLAMVYRFCAAAFRLLLRSFLAFFLSLLFSASQL